MFNLRLFVALTLLPVFTSLAFAQRGPKSPRLEVAKSPLEAKLVAKTDTYTIPAGQQGKEFAAKLKTPNARDLPEPPMIDIVFEIKNPTDSPITIVLDSDAGALDLKLEGPGAVTVEGRKIFTREYRIGKQVEIAPGKTVELPIKSLKHGFRGVAQHSYWTEPGEYKLLGVLRWPDPKAVDGDQRKMIEVAAEPVTLKIKGAE